MNLNLPWQLSILCSCLYLGMAEVVQLLVVLLELSFYFLLLSEYF